MVIKESAEAVSTTVDAMRSVPLAIALLCVNLAFLAFSGYFLREVASNARDRDKTQSELIVSLSKDCHRPGG